MQREVHMDRAQNWSQQLKVSTASALGTIKFLDSVWHCTLHISMAVKTLFWLCLASGLCLTTVTGDFFWERNKKNSHFKNLETKLHFSAQWAEVKLNKSAIPRDGTITAKEKSTICISRLNSYNREITIIYVISNKSFWKYFSQKNLYVPYLELTFLGPIELKSLGTQKFHNKICFLNSVIDVPIL